MVPFSGKTFMRKMLSLLTIILILLSGISGAGIISYDYQNQNQACSPVNSPGANMGSTSWDYLASETQTYTLLSAVSSNNYIKQLRETLNKLSISGTSPFTANKEWTYLVHFVIPISTFQNISHSIQPRAPNCIALV